MRNQYDFEYHFHRVKTNYVRSMGGRATGVRAVFRWISYAIILYAGMALGLGVLVTALELMSASLEVEVIIIFIYLVTCFLYGLTDSCSRLVEDIANFFEGALFIKTIRFFRKPFVVEITHFFGNYTNPVLGVPTIPPRSRA